MTPEAAIQWKLLGISPAEYPPTFYRLLDLPLFAADPGAIEAAYQRQVARVQPHISGPDVVPCVDLLNKLQQARTTLLNSATKEAYDAALQHVRPAAPGQLPATPTTAASTSPRPQSKTPKRENSTPKRKETSVATRLGLMAILFVVTTLMTVMFLRPEAFGLGRADLPKDVATRNKSIDVSPVSKPAPEPQTNSPGPVPQTKSSAPAPRPSTPAPAPQTNMTPPAQPMQTTTPTSPMPPAQANGASVAKLDTWKPIDTADFQPTNRQIDLVSYLMQFDEFRPYIQEAQKAAAGGRRPFPKNADLKRSQDSAKKIFEEYVEGPKTHDQHQYFFLESIKLALETKDSGADAAGILDVAENVSKYRRNVPDMLMATYVRICLYDVDSYDEEYQLLVKNISYTRVDSKSSLVDRLVWFEYCLSNARQRIPVAPEQALGYLEFILTYAKADRKLDQYHQEAAILVKQVDEVLSKRAQLAGVLKRFRRHPDSFRANLDLGFIYCFLHDDWATGLPYLAKSNYGGLSYGAQLELGPADTPEKQIAIGDEWWERRDKVREEYRGALLRHAAGWYQRALPNVTGANKVLLTQRIDAAAKAP